jgi:dTDP-4-amino-4,6-dideoxygalactose transaminase
MAHCMYFNLCIVICILVMSWVNYKFLDLESVNNKINTCIQSKQLTNNGKYVIELQSTLKKIFNINDDKEILMVCNGANGIDAIVGGVNIYYGRKLKWIVQAFTFPCSHQGLLMDSEIVDIDNDLMGPSLHILEEKINEFDCLLITNCFGATVSINDYVDFCKKHNKLLFFDNAASPLTYYNDINHLNHGNGCLVSLHHTKPIGFGEGGFIVFDKLYADAFKKAICFGYTNLDRNNYSEYAGNHKMSEIACIYVSEYLKNVPQIFTHHTKTIVYFLKELEKINNGSVSLFRNHAKYEESLLSTIPVIFDKKADIDIFLKHKIEAKKYYYPLDWKCKNSVNLYERIICLPLNIDINQEMIDLYIHIISFIINNES